MTGIEGRRPCPGCGAPASTTVGPRYTGRTGMLWSRRTFEEELFRCAEGHVYSVRVERGRSGEDVSAEVWDSLEEWLRVRGGGEPPTRPPEL